MSFKSIISAVQSKPELWLTSHPSFKNIVTRKKTWNLLAAEIGIDEIRLRKRWKYLKDQYRRELKRSLLYKSLTGECTEFISSWQYYDYMSFIKDDLLASEAARNSLKDESEDFSFKREITEADLDGEIILTPETPPPASSRRSKSSKRKKSSSVNMIITEDVLESERKKIAALEKRLKMNQLNEELQGDEDYLFLMSILPTMKKLTDLQKLRFRGKVNEWLLEEMTRSHSSRS